MSSVPQLQSAGSVAGAGPDEVYQHGTIGSFLRQELEGGFSSFIRCVYQAKRVNNNTVTLVYMRTRPRLLRARVLSERPALDGWSLCAPSVRAVGFHSWYRADDCLLSEIEK
ncbi:hypothetical protein NECAME_12648 [Necator americanus]|uniref:Uncharacterized protein n=1 Tax=Necator americanus TaxID=51031 RepID=W2SYY3_NECAM|nr:hypothetical protein NECAME_12648 [Necator americanus]ETN74900.1 hypothetical protein NECAME_12648 [Necator americanus]